MKNMELLNICQDYFNRFINSSELVEKLENIDKTNLSDPDIKSIHKMVDDIKEILANTPNEVDELVLKEKEKRQKTIQKLSQVPDDIEGLSEVVQNIKISSDKEADSKKRWVKVFEYIDNNEYFNKLFNSLSDYELLELITKKIKLMVPPILNQEKFEKLVKVGIEHDEREWLWRLAFSYEYTDIIFDSIVDYFIRVKDGYYITELISAIGDKLNIDGIFDKINDIDLIKDILDRKDVIKSYVDDEQFKKLLSKMEKLNE